MFDIGIQELIIIFIVALLVFGPKRLPELGRTIGKGLSELKRAVEDAKYQVDRELKETETEEILKKQDFNEVLKKHELYMDVPSGSSDTSKEDLPSERKDS